MDIDTAVEKIKGLQQELNLERSKLKDELFSRYNDGLLDSKYLSDLQDKIKLFKSDELDSLRSTNNLKKILKDSSLVNQIKVECTDETSNDSAYIYKQYNIKLDQSV